MLALFIAVVPSASARAAGLGRITAFPSSFPALDGDERLLGAIERHLVSAVERQ
jgi:hypothetical protein